MIDAPVEVHPNEKDNATASVLDPFESRVCSLLNALIWMLLCSATLRAWAAPWATTTSLTITSGGSAVTTVASGSVVTLTATVMAGTTPVTVGLVNLCDATANYCTDTDIDAVAAAAHAAGVKVFLSLGGGGAQMIIQYYNAGLSAPLVASPDRYIRANHFDGADVDIEDPANMGQPYASFVFLLTLNLHTEPKVH